MEDFVVVDIETTGLSPKQHKITEIAAVHLQNGEVVNEFHTLVNPEVSIPPFITRLTGITDEMVQDAPSIHEVMPNFLSFVGDKTFVAHNASFDYGFLHHHSEGKLCNNVMCTRRMANKLLPDLYSKKLGVLCDVLNVTNDEAHRALSDTRATAEVLLKFLNLAKAHEMEPAMFVTRM